MALQIERDEYLRTFQSYTNRFRHSYEASYSTNPLYYSTNIGREPHSQQLSPRSCTTSHPAFVSARRCRLQRIASGKQGSADDPACVSWILR